MRSTSALCKAAVIAAPVLADVHYLYTGYFDYASISGIEFDDAANTLTLVNNYSVTSGSSRWIAADVRKPLPDPHSLSRHTQATRTY